MHRQANNTYQACSFLIDHQCLALSIYLQESHAFHHLSAYLLCPDQIILFLTANQWMGQARPRTKKNMVYGIGSGVCGRSLKRIEFGLAGI